MNLPNRLTLARLIMTPLFFVAFYLPMWFNTSLQTLSTVLVLLLFIAIEATDLLDGIIARKRDLVTDLGKVMDPFADTFARLTYFVCLMSVDIFPIIAFVVILWRELAQSFIRSLMMREGKALPANIWGKTKAVLYAISAVAGVIYLILLRSFSTLSVLPLLQTILNVLFYISAFASIASFFTYIYQIKKSKILSHLSM
ncbi:MAG: CDP-diacylglycerol--glycerol-3-phosphate 3-phosphatidyltransferase [Sphaerochaetaceae bacterium]|nr:CDP-diacylglycerol--glycerol-3-phosphate 3-phosphatidyltransferase [Sphaerochaetaceae bacterium]MDC7243517.1 CDP-diacylglycerol--glycerol-3-phosphate 3-phosphatidyltransferase [Sphaerochaetaceae bacterium]MDC7250679.1 CDP-diacylglycerol--glycerol-3-phosphate 3-phosphatidyltransferase [Sphaerochaetaceae bacterium]